MAMITNKFAPSGLRLWHSSGVYTERALLLTKYSGSQFTASEAVAGGSGGAIQVVGAGGRR